MDLQTPEGITMGIFQQIPLVLQWSRLTFYTGCPGAPNFVMQEDQVTHFNLISYMLCKLF